MAVSSRENATSITYARYDRSDVYDSIPGSQANRGAAERWRRLAGIRLRAWLRRSERVT